MDNRGNCDVRTERPAAMPGDDYARRIVVQLKPGTDPDADEELSKLALRPLFESFDANHLRRLRGVAAMRMREWRDAPDFELMPLEMYYACTRPSDEVDANGLLETLHSHDSVRLAYAESGPAVPPGLTSRTVAQSAIDRGYMSAAPLGIDVESVRHAGYAGHDGAGTQLVDVEYGWNFDHQDLREADIERLSSDLNVDSYIEHGTNVLGVIAAQGNGPTGRGIAPGAAIGLSSQWRRHGNVLYINTADAVMVGIDALEPGDVLLLEAQTDRYLPVDCEPAIRDAIRQGVALGITVVAAAGNGGLDLDVDHEYADVLDSGAVIVGAATSGPVYRKVEPASFPAFMQQFGLPDSNYGSRIDCFSWGQDVVTSSVGDNRDDLAAYTDSFRGTSSAAAIVAGAVLVVQGIARERYGEPLLPWQVRKLLGTGGTKSTDPDTDRIGEMPRLSDLLDRMANIDGLRGSDPETGDEPENGEQPPCDESSGDEPCDEADRDKVMSIAIYESSCGASYELEVRKRGWLHAGNKGIVAELLCSMASNIALLSSGDSEPGTTPPSGSNGIGTKKPPPPSGGDPCSK